MAKNNLVLLATLLLTLLATSLAYTTTIVITTNDDESNPGGQCASELQGRRFQSCQSYFTWSSSQSSYDDEIREVVVNPGQQEQEYLRSCCDRIGQVSQQCQCEAIRGALTSALEQQHEVEQMRRQIIIQKAASIPSQCGLKVQQCHITAIIV